MTAPRAPFTLALALLAGALTLAHWALALPPSPSGGASIGAAGRGEGMVHDALLLLMHTPLSQLLHATTAHLLADALAFLLLGLLFEPHRGSRSWARTTACAGAFCWLAWLALYPHQRSLLGLSAINHFLLAAGLASLAPRWKPAWALLCLLLAHGAWETFAGDPPLRIVDIDDAPGVSRVPALHLAASLAGLLAASARSVPDSRNQGLATATN